jgi:osmoprotectant transport system ATP-binding protein
VVFVGPSGCGKTTTMKMVNRLIDPTSGRILIDGRDVTREDPVAVRRGIGYVIQQVGLFRTRPSPTTSPPCRGCSAGTAPGSAAG